MLKKITHFITYNNAFTLTLGALFLATGGAFAASPAIQEAVGDALIQKEETVTSIDNTYLVKLDMSQFDPGAQVTEITEDDESYYLVYKLSTIDLADSAWKKVIKEKNLKVSKRDLGDNDLGLYVAEELGEVIAREKEYISNVQNIEKSKGPKQKTVATTYSGLIGKFLSVSEEVFPGYEPVVQPPAPAPEPQPAAAVESVPPVEPAPVPQPVPEPAQEETPAPAPEPEPEPAPEPEQQTISASSTPETSAPSTDTEVSTSTPESVPAPEPEPETTTSTSTLDAEEGVELN